MRTWGLICVALSIIVITTVASNAAPTPYLGVYSEVNEDPPGLRVQLAPGSPAADAGLRNGDVILGIDDVMFGDSETAFAEQLTSAIAVHKIGDTITIHVYRDAPEMTLSKNGEPVDTPWPRDEFDSEVEQSDFGDTVELKSEKLKKYIDLQATLGPRPDTLGTALPPNDALFPGVQDAHPEVRVLLNQLVDAASNEDDTMVRIGGDAPRDVRADTDDLMQRLDARATPDDGFRLKRVSYLLRDGMKAESITRGITSQIGMSAKSNDGNQLAEECSILSSLLDVKPVYFYAMDRFKDGSCERIRDSLPAAANKRLDESEIPALTREDLQQCLEDGILYCGDIAKQAFQNYSDDEIDFIKKQRKDLSDSFASMTYVDSEDDNQQRAQNNVKLIKLANRIIYQHLIDAMQAAPHPMKKIGTRTLREILYEVYADSLTKDVLFDEDTEYGRIVITGTGESWFTGPQPALHIDLGGDDFYTYTEGGGSSLDTPVGVIIDLGGNDAYESTTPFCQGSGSMGVSLLVDTEGDDHYIGLQWAQGCGFFGCGALIDMAGNDTYRGEEFCQAAAIFGTGLLLDYGGNDHYEAQMKSQGFGGAHAVGLLIDVAGDDYRYAKGNYPTGYGDPGIFDAWSQGCAMGFRGLASGGIAGVIDMAGSDYNEAGNFSQGGGYYFGFGFFHDMGWEDDVYVGSRYNQGFCAHQAVGCFLEDGGDDRYYTRQAVAQGLAWDECVTMFIDYGGNDYYDGGTGFSQGASAHNSLCIFWDVDGRDTYVYKPGQARAGGNDYHGGTSLSLFIDTGGDTDWYDSQRSGNNLVTGWPEHGFFADLPGTLDAAVKDDAWKSIWTPYISEK